MNEGHAERIAEGRAASFIKQATQRIVEGEIIDSVLNTAVRQYNAGVLTEREALIAIASIATMRRFLGVLDAKIDDADMLARRVVD